MAHTYRISEDLSNITFGPVEDKQLLNLTMNREKANRFLAAVEEVGIETVLADIRIIAEQSAVPTSTQQAPTPAFQTEIPKGAVLPSGRPNPWISSGQNEEEEPDRHIKPSIQTSAPVITPAAVSTPSVQPTLVQAPTPVVNTPTVQPTSKDDGNASENNEENRSALIKRLKNLNTQAGISNKGVHLNKDCGKLRSMIEKVERKLGDTPQSTTPTTHIPSASSKPARTVVTRALGENDQWYVLFSDGTYEVEKT